MSSKDLLKKSNYHVFKKKMFLLGEDFKGL